MTKVESLEKMQKSGSYPAVDLSDPDVAAIVQIAKDFCEAWKNGDLETIMDAYSRDVIKISQGAVNRGKEDLERGYRDLLSKCSVQVKVQIEEVQILSPSMAFDRANFKLTATPKAGGEAMVSSGQFLEVLRKENGKWKSLRAMNTVDK